MVYYYKIVIVFYLIFLTILRLKTEIMIFFFAKQNFFAFFCFANVSEITFRANQKCLKPTQAISWTAWHSEEFPV
jgi:hypothetical protein